MYKTIAVPSTKLVQARREMRVKFIYVYTGESKGLWIQNKWFCLKRGIITSI
jgi:hypothetical protein